MGDEQLDTSRSLLDLPHPMMVYLDELLKAHTINQLNKAFEFRPRNIPDLTHLLAPKYPELDMFFVWALLEHMEWEGHLSVAKKYSDTGEIEKYDSKLTMRGYLFRMHGGYKRKDELEKSSIKEKAEEKRLQQISINAAITADTSTTTMNEVTLPGTFNFQKAIGIVSIITAILSTAFIGVTIYQQSKSKTDSELQLIRTTIQDQQKTMQLIEHDLKELNSSIIPKKIVVDSVKAPSVKVRN